MKRMKWSEVQVTQSCPTLWDLMDYTVHGILQARILEWAAFPFSRGSSQPRDRTHISHIAGGFFTNCAIREAHDRDKIIQMKSFFPLSLQAEEISYKDGYSHGERRMTQRVRTKISKGATKISSESFSGK